MMARKTTEVQLADGRTRYCVRIEDDYECAEGSRESVIRQMMQLRVLADGMAPPQCGDGPYQTLRHYHDGVRWVLEMEAVRDSRR